MGLRPCNRRSAGRSSAHAQEQAQVCCCCARVMLEIAAELREAVASRPQQNPLKQGLGLGAQIRVSWHYWNCAIWTYEPPGMHMWLKDGLVKALHAPGMEEWLRQGDAPQRHSGQVQKSSIAHFMAR